MTMELEVAGWEGRASLVEMTGQMRFLADLEEAGVATRTSLQLEDPTIPFETVDAMCAFFGEAYRRIRWYSGDVLNFAEGVYGEKYPQAAAAFGVTEQTVLQWRFVCANVPKERRVPALGFGCHNAVSRLGPKEQTYWLKQAEKKGWTEADLRAAMKAKRKDTAPPLFDDPPPLDTAAVIEVAQAIARDAVAHIDSQHFLVPSEDIARLKAALGEE